MPPQPNSPSSVCGASTSARCHCSITQAPPPSPRSGGGVSAAGTTLGARRARRGRRGPTSSGPRRTRCRRASARRSRRARGRRRARADAAPRLNAARKQRDEQRGEEREARKPRLGRDGHRRVMRRRLLRILALEPHAFSVRAFEAADADTEHGMARGDADPVRDEARAGRSSRCSGRSSCGAAANVASAAARHEMPASTATASDDRDSARQRHATNAAPITTTSSAAKLDCENEISRPSQVTTTTAAAASDQRSDAPEGDQDDRRRHRHHEEAPVHRRIPEDGVDAEERRVRIREDHLRVLEDVAGLVLVDADDREREPPSASPRRTAPAGRARLHGRRAIASASKVNGT